MKLTKIKKRTLIEELSRVVYCNKKKDKKTTHCILQVSIHLGKDLDWNYKDVLEKKFNSENYEFRYENAGSELVCKATITAKATCSADDVFDEKKGKTVAYSKAQLKAYNLAKRLYAVLKHMHAVKSAAYDASYMSMIAYYNREVSFLKGM